MTLHRKAAWFALALGALPRVVLAEDDLNSILSNDAVPAAPAPAAVAAAPVPAESESAPASVGPTGDTTPKAAAAAPAVSGGSPIPVTAARQNKAPANRLVEEIVVTAQKREEKLQDVPISIQAFTQEKLDVLGIQSVQDVQRATPGFTVTVSAGFNITFLRGVGSDAFLPGVDSSVPFYLDGVPLVAIQGTADTLGRISRIEVLKGPQGTLFGRNATGGAISIITPDPNQKLSGDVKTEYGNHNQHNIVAYANVPVTDKIAFNVSGFQNRRDNILTNDYTGGVYPFYARGGRVKLRWDALDNLTFTLSGEYQENSSNGDLGFQLLYPALPFAALLPAKPKLDQHVDLDRFGTQNQTYILGANIQWKTDYFTSKLIYAKQNLKSPHVDADFDGTSTPLADAHGAGFAGSAQFDRQDTAELQFVSNENSPLGERLQWAAGLFYLSSLGGFNPIVFELAPAALSALPGPFSPVTGPATALINSTLQALNLQPLLGSDGINLANYGLIGSRSYSIYGQATYHVIDTVDFTAGARFQDEHRELVGSRTTYELNDGTQVLIPFPQNDKEILRPKQTSLRGALQWRPFGPDNQIYASFARGFKNPTYNTVNLVGNLVGTMFPLQAERVDTTELGVKTKLFDGSVQFNAAGFYTAQKNPLSSNVTIISGGIANFINAGKAVIKGADGDFLIIPLQERDPGLVVTGGFSYLDAIYTSFVNGRGYDDATGLGFGDGGASLPARDLSGKRIPRVPRWSYQSGISQRIDFNDNHSVEIGGDMFFNGKIYFLPQNSEKSKRDPTRLFNARVSYFYHPWNLEATLFGTNLSNKIYANSAFVSDFGTAQIANEDPRFFGLRIKVSYE